MRCGARDAAECLHDHVWPHLKDPRATKGGGYSAMAPCHDDATCSLSVGLGDRQFVVWCCHACQKRLGVDMAQIRTRTALIRAGTPARCLPIPRALLDSMVDQFREVLSSGESQVDKVFRLAVLTECGGEMPAGSELDRLAEWSGVSRRAAYRARLASTDNL